MMAVLLYLCQHPQQIISADQLIEHCWPKQYISDNPVHKCIAQLRRALDDDAKNPHYIKTWPKKGYAIITTVRGLQLGQTAAPAHWLTGPPYPGFNSYTAQESSIFFGRNKAISELKYLLNQTCQQDFAMICLMGSSGVGKTSLMQAAILPYLSNPDYPFKPPIRTVLQHTINGRGDQLAAFITYLQGHDIFDPRLSQAELIAVAEQEPKHLLTYYQAKQTQQPGKEVLFVDQLERLFTDKDPQHKHADALLLMLVQLVQSKQFMVLTAIQHECYAKLMQSKVFVSIKAQVKSHDLLPPTASELAEIITKPVAAAGLSYQFDTNSYRALDEQITTDMGLVAHVLPLLNHTLRELCLQVDEQNQLTFAAYQNIGGLTGSVAYKADEFFLHCSAEHIQAFESKLHHLIQFGHYPSHQLICAKADSSCFNDPQSKHVIKHLLAARLLHAEVIEDTTYVSIVHESLLEQCQLFRLWISRNRLKLSVSKEIKNRAQNWQDNQRHPHYLLHNQALLNQAQALMADAEFTFNRQQTTFIEASAKKQRRKKFLKHGLLAALLLLLCSSAVLLYKFQGVNKQLRHSQEKAENLIAYMIEELKEQLRAVGKSELLGNISQQVMAYYDNNPQQPESVLHRIEALNTLGEVKFNQGELAAAETYFQQAQKHYQQHEASEVPQLLFKISQSHYWLGYLAYLQNQPAATERYWLNYLHFSEQLVELEPDHNPWQLELSYALNNLGTLHYNRKDYSQAKQYMDQSATIKQALLKAEPQNTQFMAELADTLSWQASIADQMHQLQLGKDSHEQSLRLTQQLYQLDPDNQMWKHRLAQAHYRLALKHYDMGELAPAKTELEQSLPLFQQLHDTDPSNQGWIRELANCHLALAKVFKHNQQLDEAILNLNLGSQYTELYSVEHQQLDTTLIQQLALMAESSLILLQLQQPKAALSQFEKTATQFKQLNQLQGKQKNYYQAYLHYVLGMAQQANGQAQAGQASLQVAFDHIKQNQHPADQQDKKSMALSIVIARQLQDQSTDQAMINFLSQVNYNNPDYH